MKYSEALTLIIQGNKSGAGMCSNTAPAPNQNERNLFIMATINSKVRHDLPHEAVIGFLSKVKNVCDGVGAVLALNYAHEGERLEANDLAPETALTMIEMESLMSLARASTELLHREAEHMERWAETYHSDAGALRAYEEALNLMKHRGLKVSKV